jgi:hypothetical protein
VGGVAEQLSATAVQRALEPRGSTGSTSARCAPYVIRFFYRDELRVGYLIRCLLRLVVKVDISGRYVDEASHLPRPKVFRNGTFSYCRAPCRLNGLWVVVEPPFPQCMRETGASE